MHNDLRLENEDLAPLQKEASNAGHQLSIIDDQTGTKHLSSTEKLRPVTDEIC